MPKSFPRGTIFPFERTRSLIRDLPGSAPSYVGQQPASTCRSMRERFPGGVLLVWAAVHCTVVHIPAEQFNERRHAVN